MFVPIRLEPNEIGFVKLSQVLTDEPQNTTSVSDDMPKSSLTAQGFTENGEVVFDYENEEQ